MSKNIYAAELLNKIDDEYISSCLVPVRKKSKTRVLVISLSLALMLTVSLLGASFLITDEPENPTSVPPESAENTQSTEVEVPLPNVEDYIVEDGVMLGYTGNDEVIMIPYEVKSISADAFAGATSVKVVYLNPNVESVDDSALTSCPNLEDVIVGENTHITDYGGIILDETKTKILYWNKNGIGEKVVVPEGVQSLPNRFLQGNEKVKELILPESLKSIGENALKFCRKLEKVDFGGCEVISEGAFSLSTIKEVDLGDSMKRIEDDAFLKSSVTKIVFPKSMEYMSASAFKYCDLEVVEYEGSEYAFDFIKYYFSDLKNVKYIYGEETPESMKLIYYSNGDGTCYVGPSSSDIDARYVVIPERSPEGDTVTGVKSFEGCDIIRFIMPDTVVYLEERTFKDCKNLEIVELSSNITHLPDYAFAGCDALKDLRLPAGIRTLGAYAFSNNLDYWKNKRLFEAFFGGNEDYDCVFDHTFAGSTSLEGIVWGIGYVRNVNGEIANGIELCGTFENCSNMTWVSIGKRVIKIDADTFKGCTSLEEISYSGTLEEWIELSKEWADMPELEGVVISVKVGYRQSAEYIRTENGEYLMVESQK